MPLPVHAEGVYDTEDSEALHRIFAAARQALVDRISVDDELEWRLAVIVLFAYSVETKWDLVPLGEEGGIARTCVDRLLAQTSGT